MRTAMYFVCESLHQLDQCAGPHPLPGKLVEVGRGGRERLIGRILETKA